jgi:hypothetical protein
MPTTPTTTASFAVEGAIPENTFIGLDINGDGKTDSTFYADGAELSLDQLLILLKEKINSLDVKNRYKQKLLNKVLNLEKKIDKFKQKDAKFNKKKALEKSLNNLVKNINKNNQRGKIGDADAQALIDLLTQIEGVV